MLKTLGQNVKASYVHDYGQSELNLLKSDATKLSLDVAECSYHLLVPDDPGVGGMLKINLYSYRKTGRTGQRGSYAKKKRHDRQYLLNKRRQVKKNFELFQTVRRILSCFRQKVQTVYALVSYTLTALNSVLRHLIQHWIRSFHG